MHPPPPPTLPQELQFDSNSELSVATYGRKVFDHQLNKQEEEEGA